MYVVNTEFIESPLESQEPVIPLHIGPSQRVDNLVPLAYSNGRQKTCQIPIQDS